MAQYIAEFLKLPYISHVNPEDVQLGVLPTPFCRSNHVVVVGPPASPERERWRAGDVAAKKAFVLSNPFDWDLIENLKRFTGLDETSNLT
ncbi:MAG: hypothetical protein JRF35_03580 [Deltaproteobacteria bacterium]|nr:hypothetical protein [Deltaproteobacteria bacterium]